MRLGLGGMAGSAAGWLDDAVRASATHIACMAALHACIQVLVVADVPACLLPASRHLPCCDLPYAVENRGLVDAWQQVGRSSS